MHSLEGHRIASSQAFPTDRVLLRRAWKIGPEDQIAMQAAVQRDLDAAVSKTVRLDPTAIPIA